jgi:hypothetical protein
MKWLIVLIALMNILVFSKRNRLTRRSHNKSRVQTEAINLKILDSESYEKNEIIFDGKVKITYENEGDDLVTLVVNDEQPNLREDFFTCDKDKINCWLQVHRSLCVTPIYEVTTCGLRYGSLQLVSAKLIPGPNDKLIFDENFNQDFAEIRNQYMEKVKSLLKTTPEDFELHRQELYYISHITDNNIGMRYVKNFETVLKETENGIIDLNFILNIEEMIVLESVKNDLAVHYQIFLTELSNNGDKEKLVIQLKAKMFEKLLEHLGVNNSKYEFVESNEKFFITNYCEKIYLNMINKIIMNSNVETDQKAFQSNIFNLITQKIIYEINSAYRFGKKTQQNETFIIPKGILDGKRMAIKFPEPNLNERRNLIFLRKIRFESENRFLQKLSLIDSKRWELKI